MKYKNSKLYYLINKNRLSMVIWTTTVSMVGYLLFVLIGWDKFTIGDILVYLISGICLGLAFYAIQKKKGIHIKKEEKSNLQ